VTINLHIERLIVEGMSIDQRGKAQLRRAITQQLTAHLAERGLPLGVQSQADLRSLNGETISFTDSDRPSDTGQKIGSAIYRGMRNIDTKQTFPGESASPTGGSGKT